MGKEILDGFRPKVITLPDAAGIPQSAKFHAEKHAVARDGVERLADEQFVVPHSVEVAGIQQGDSGVDRCVQRRETFPAVCRTVHTGHAHAAESERRDRGTRFAEL